MMKSWIVSLYISVYLAVIAMLPYRPFTAEEEWKHQYAQSWLWGVDYYPTASIK